MENSHPFILVVGGAGYIGSHVNSALNSLGYKTVVFDDLSTGCSKAVKDNLFVGSLDSKKDIESVFSQYPCRAVMHFAALTDVGESMAEPAKYYTKNVINTLNLLEAMRQHNIKTFLFSSSAAIFGAPLHLRINEEHPCNPINPYGNSKLMIEKILYDYDLAYALKSSCLRYFNAAGGDPAGKMKNHKQKDNNLIPVILRNLLKNKKKIVVFGDDYPTFDGTCIRDYIHVSDLASAHVLAMEKLLRENSSSRYNLGNGNGFSVLQVIQAVEKVTGEKLQIIKGARRPGDPPILIADSLKAQRELKWETRYPELEEMIAHAWQALQDKNEN